MAKILVKICAFYTLAEQKIGFFGPETSFLAFDVPNEIVDPLIALNFDYSYVQFHAGLTKLWSSF